MALATRYAVNTHVDSSTLADRLPAMCGSATLATLVSSTSMNVASITVPAITHGLISRDPCANEDSIFVLPERRVRQDPPDVRRYRVKMVASTFIPGRNVNP